LSDDVLRCEPTGYRWKPLLDRARACGIEQLDGHWCRLRHLGARRNT
jgi:hypothetical protein